MAAPPTPPPPAPAPQRPAGAPRWLLPAAIGVIAGLLIGFTAGWFGFRSHLTASMNAAVEEVEADLAGATPLEETGPVEEEEGVPAGPPAADSPDDGLFEYTATGSERKTTYNDSECGQTYRAEGEFIVIGLKAENVGSAPGMPAVSMGEVTAYDTAGAAYSTFDDICSFTEEVNPGGSTDYEVVIEAPEGTEFAVLELAGYEAPGIAVIGVEE
ncbi:hypothetical protein J0910_14370 [Nocardiopsis sp. CNT-189]|uniref:hypothetical protein n=1 Tax=Nocardiopsis oceanisediminis TaxID=2816862 RepID=UPI003B2E8B6C